MAETDAVFGGEHSGHFYFRDFWRADSGMLAALHVLAALAEQDRPLSELLAEYSRYVATGEINSTVADQAAVVAEIEQTYGARDGVTLDHLDGLTVTHRRLVVQCPRVQHRAAAAAQRRGRGPGHARRGCATTCSPRSGETHEPRPRPAGDHRLPGLPRRAGRRRGRLTSWSARPAGWPTRSATTSRCCSSTRPAAREPARSADGRDLRRLAPRRRDRARDGRPRRCGRWPRPGARVRREAGGRRRGDRRGRGRCRSARPARAPSSPPAPTRGCSGPSSSRGARCRSWPGPDRRCRAGPAASTWSSCSRPRAATPAPPPRSPRRSAAAAAWWSPARRVPGRRARRGPATAPCCRARRATSSPPPS